MDAAKHQVLMGRDRRPAVGVVVVFADDHVAVVEQATQLVERLGDGEVGALPDQQPRQGGFRRQQLQGAMGGPGRDRRLAGERAQGLEDAHIHHPGLGAQGDAVEVEGGAGPAAGTQHVLKGRHAGEQLLPIHPQPGQGGLQQAHKRLGLLGLEDAGRQFLQLQATTGHQVAQAVAGEPAQVGAVEQAFVGLRPAALEQVGQHRPVLHVRHTGQQDPLIAEQCGMAAQGAPGIPQVLQHVAVDQAIEGRQVRQGQRLLLGIGAQHMVEAAGGPRCRLLHLLQAHVHHLRLDRLEGGPEGPGATAHLQHGAGGDRNALQQVGIDAVVVTGTGGHGLGSGGLAGVGRQLRQTGWESSTAVSPAPTAPAGPL